MLKNGLENLRVHEEEVNSLNVFPVADGDTGTNMRLTLSKGMKNAPDSTELCDYLRGLSEGMLMGARGNSGVILSQLFNGLHRELSHCKAANVKDLSKALIRAYKQGYASVVHPVEGTILTVAREGIEHIYPQLDRVPDIETMLAMYVAEMKKTLAHTPEMLAELREAGVIDSGGYGYILIWEGMVRFICGEIIDSGVHAEEDNLSVPTVNFDPELFNETSVFQEGYCTEFILQLMNDRYRYVRFNLDQYIHTLEGMGNSLVVVRDGTRVKVHVHSLKPAEIIAYSQGFGEFVSFKLENMQIQHNEHIRRQSPPKKHKPNAFVAAANGSGMREIFEELGCDIVIGGETAFNTSAQEFMDAFRAVDADLIVVLPNDKNNQKAAEQAASLYADGRVEILPTRSVAEGYYAIAMDIPDNPDIEERLALMREGQQSVSTLAVTTAVRDTVYTGISCKKGERIALLDDELVCVSADWNTALIEGLRRVEDIDERDSCIVFAGMEVEPEEEDALVDVLAEAFPMLEATVLHGGQAVYRWIIGLP